MIITDVSQPFPVSYDTWHKICIFIIRCLHPQYLSRVWLKVVVQKLIDINWKKPLAFYIITPSGERRQYFSSVFLCQIVKTYFTITLHIYVNTNANLRATCLARLKTGTVRLILEISGDFYFITGEYIVKKIISYYSSSKYATQLFTFCALNWLSPGTRRVK